MFRIDYLTSEYDNSIAILYHHSAMQHPLHCLALHNIQYHYNLYISTDITPFTSISWPLCNMMVTFPVGTPSSKSPSTVCIPIMLSVTQNLSLATCIVLAVTMAARLRMPWPWVKFPYPWYRCSTWNFTACSI